MKENFVLGLILNPELPTVITIVSLVNRVAEKKLVEGCNITFLSIIYICSINRVNRLRTVGNALKTFKTHFPSIY